MKNLILTAVFAIATTALIQPSFAHKKDDYPVHVLPDQEISFEQIPLALSFDGAVSDYVNEAIRVGKKNMDWLKHMNSMLPDGQKIALTKPGELTPIPIHTPKIYSPQTIERDFKEISASTPESMQKIIFGNADFTNDPGVDIQTYIEWAKKVDKMYQTSARWLLIKPHLAWYKQYKAGDIRGYYYLAKEENLTDKLSQFTSLSAEEKSRLTPLLVNVCENTEGLTICERILDKAIANGGVSAFYQKYLPHSKKTFEEYFILSGKRPDITWTSSEPNRAQIPIRDTKNLEINEFLEYNIEDEWKWDNWNLDLVFTPNANVRVEFVAGETPHVNGLGGNIITMDANAPLTEWDVQWTIRHEFGHVLGFPDCYVEFYDSNLKAMVNYQIDTTNMMCSRAGKMQELHYSEMKRTYFN